MTVFYSPSNIALVKYWGKRDPQLNLPTNSSLSLSLGQLGTYTEALFSDEDELIFNGERLNSESAFYQKVFQFADLFYQHTLFKNNRPKLTIKTKNTIPTASGLASSASGFSALTLALNDCFQTHLSHQQLSILARQGSGSACRSLWTGFVKWEKGQQSDGSDCHGVPLESHWTDLRIGILKVSLAEKSVSSRNGMNHTVSTSPLYEVWAKTAENDLKIIENAIKNQDFQTLGQTAEGNALAMHATMISARPALCYWQAQTLDYLHYLWRLRADGLNAYATIDAGANVKLLFLNQEVEAIKSAFPDILMVQPYELPSVHHGIL